MTRLYLLCFLFWFDHALAALSFLSEPNFVNESSIYEIEPNTQIHAEIDRIYEKIFSSHVKEALCKLFPSSNSLAHSLGIGFESAARINKACYVGALKAVSPIFVPGSRNSKIFEKRYFLVKSTGKGENIQSWTTYDNKTFLWMFPGITEKDLQNVLAHELAIAMDAKSGILLTSYFEFQNLNSLKTADGTVIVTVPKTLDPRVEKLRRWFNFSLDPAVNLAFKVMRAFNFENYVNGTPSLTSLSHAQCRKVFEKSLKFYLDNEKVFKEPIDSFWGGWVEVLSHKGDWSSFRSLVQEIMSDETQMPHDPMLTFCQYMALPLLTNKSYHSFMSNGPRPRVGGGGWLTEDGAGADF